MPLLGIPPSRAGEERVDRVLEPAAWAEGLVRSRVGVEAHAQTIARDLRRDVYLREEAQHPAAIPPQIDGALGALEVNGLRWVSAGDGRVREAVLECVDGALHWCVVVWGGEA
jgi:hypothetical protein